MAVAEDPPPPRRPIAITPGEPAGIGPDLVLELALHTSNEIVAVADPSLLRERASMLGLSIRIEEIAHRGMAPADGRILRVLPVAMAKPARCGKLDVRNASYVLETLRRAVAGCMDGEFAALVTGPVHKGIINDAGFTFSGHTEFLGELSGTSRPVMMLATPALRVALATTHLALRDVPDAISDDLLESVIRVLVNDLRSRFGIPNPHVTVCGLNPHAGEEGHLGREELDVIRPVLERLRAAGFELSGPIPADTAFTPSRLKRTDVVLAMFHDQGLPVLKHSGFGNAVNVTLGLPFVRTSVDHGTALDLAGSGKAGGGSLLEALRMAATLSGSGPAASAVSVPG